MLLVIDFLLFVDNNIVYITLYLFGSLIRNSLSCCYEMFQSYTYLATYILLYYRYVRASITLVADSVFCCTVVQYVSSLNYLTLNYFIKFNVYNLQYLPEINNIIHLTIIYTKKQNLNIIRVLFDTIFSKNTWIRTFPEYF